MTKPWTPPQIELFQRLKVQDGTLINEQKWNIANDYHRRRQNIHYQSLNLGGIVSGLDVKLTFKDNSYFLIFQSGIAIDRYGNCIVVEKARGKKINSQVTPGESKLVYFVINYKEPTLKNKDEEIITEQFEINERSAPPDETELELCRIKITSNRNIAIAKDVFNPQDNELDFRYRPQARWRSHSTIRTAIYQNSGTWQEVFSDDLPTSNFSYLLQSLNHLYPSLQSLQKGDFHQINSLLDYDLINLTDQQFNNFNDEEIRIIDHYLEAGSVILVQHLTNAINIQKLMYKKQEIQQNLAELETIDGYEYECQILWDELQSINQTLGRELQQIANHYDHKLNTELQSLEYLTNHPLRTTPFLFHQLPSINKQGISILTDGGLVVLIGNLPSAWGINDNRYLSRDTIRNAQELGINILHFAAQRKQLTQLAKQ
ncbi:hypothetical protein H6F32_09230 [Anabaena sp. FACHB-1237]|uniref:hypothetical protein n=1 Tax=Anabaena sp. FACHB-1237 TaxID=2692769 RepID=UPI001680DB44|nr:hypothetical protein [Anabaena sp. FACHB-1237]MBD2137767.1 hypothetical protein [Anabaena sp. FACHB-1237]